MDGEGDARREAKLEGREVNVNQENCVMFKTFASLTLCHFLAIALL